MAEREEKVPYYEQVANKLIEQLQAGTAPWQKPWAPGSIHLPHNPVSGTRYKGSNSMWLEMQGRDDPRWMTYKQANSVDAQVRRGEKGTLVQYWKLTDQIPVKDERGKPLLDGEGNNVYRTVQLEKPKVFSAVVFNAEQIDGLPPLQIKTPDWDRHERAEAVLQASGVDIRHDQPDRAFYRPATDRIHLPARDSFKSADTYYAPRSTSLGHCIRASHPPGPGPGPPLRQRRLRQGGAARRDRLPDGRRPARHRPRPRPARRLRQELGPGPQGGPQGDPPCLQGRRQDRRLRAEPGEGEGAIGHREAAAGRAALDMGGCPEGTRRGEAHSRSAKRLGRER